MSDESKLHGRIKYLTNQSELNKLTVAKLKREKSDLSRQLKNATNGSTISILDHNIVIMRNERLIKKLDEFKAYPTHEKFDAKLNKIVYVKEIFFEKDEVENLIKENAHVEPVKEEEGGIDGNS